MLKKKKHPEGLNDALRSVPPPARHTEICPVGETLDSPLSSRPALNILADDSSDIS